jgi:flagellar export protein FliJ
MARFKFRLDTLLRLREALRDQRRGELAQAYEAEQILGQHDAEIDSQIEAMVGDRRDASAAQVNVDRLMETQQYEMILQAEKRTIAQQREQLDEEIERRRDALVQADRDVRVLENLRERHLQRHRQREQQIEAKQLDEIGTIQFSREHG